MNNMISISNEQKKVLKFLFDNGLIEGDDVVDKIIIDYHTISLFNVDGEFVAMRGLEHHFPDRPWGTVITRDMVDN